MKSNNENKTICPACFKSLNRKVVWGSICPYCDSYIPGDQEEPYFIINNKIKYNTLKKQAINQVIHNRQRRRMRDY